MKRRLFNFTCVLSLLLAVATVVFWFRSTTRRDVVGYLPWAHSNHSYVIQSEQGLLQFEIYPNNGPFSYAFSIDQSAIRKNRLLDWVWLFELDTEGNQAAETVPHLWVPHWFVAMLLLILPMYWVGRRWRSRKRIETGLCQQCGYDLRATPERCPECGTITVTAKLD